MGYYNGVHLYIYITRHAHGNVHSAKYNILLVVLYIIQEQGELPMCLNKSIPNLTYDHYNEMDKP